MNKRKEIRLEVEELEERIVPGTLTITTSSGETMSRSLNDVVRGHLETAQEHTNGVITWTPSP
jgi:hypothetical protein